MLGVGNEHFAGLGGLRARPFENRPGGAAGRLGRVRLAAVLVGIFVLAGACAEPRSNAVPADAGVDLRGSDAATGGDTVSDLSTLPDVAVVDAGFADLLVDAAGEAGADVKADSAGSADAADARVDVRDAGCASGGNCDVCATGFKRCGAACIATTACCPATEPPVCASGALRTCMNGVVTSVPCPFGCAGAACVACAAPVTCFADTDRDGFGDAKQTKQFCGACDEGFVPSKTDCYDLNAMAFPRGPVPVDTFDDFFAMHRGDGSFDYSCDGRVQTTPGDPAAAQCAGVGATCDIVRGDFAATACGTLVPIVTCSCSDAGSSCAKSCRLLGASGTRIQVRCR